jgi:DNA-binding MarR family transcriptional regulator
MFRNLPEYSRCVLPGRNGMTIVLTKIVSTNKLGPTMDHAASEPGSRRGPCPEEAAYLDLLRTAEMISRPLARLLKAADLSSTQYNVLRILRGSPQGLTCGEIGDRMITREPDITRLLDRLEKRCLISRCRETKDRRMVLTRIAPEGLELLAQLDGPIRDRHRKTLGHLGDERIRVLHELLALCRDGLE